jgi:hypothetical protein
MDFVKIVNFSLCVLEDPNAPESGEDCFKPITLGDGSPKYVLPNKEEEDNDTVNLTLKLPDGLTCDRCVLRWNYNAGNIAMVVIRKIFFAVGRWFQNYLGSLFSEQIFFYFLMSYFIFICR